MKTDRRISAAIAAALATVITVAGLTCLVTAFALPVYSWGFLSLGCLLASLFCVLWLSCKHPLPLGLAALILLFWQLQTDHLSHGLQALLYRISDVYNKGYGWGVLIFSDLIALDDVSCGPALLLLGSMIAAVICFTVYHRKWTVAGILTGLLPLILCCVVTDTLPNNSALMVLMAGLLLMLLPALLRRTNLEQANRITALLLIPVILFTGIIFSRGADLPYQEQADRLQSWFLDLFPGVSHQQGSVGGSVAGDSVNLGAVGPLHQSTATQLYVRSSAHEILYLRGRSYDLYTGTGWDSAADTTGENGWPLGDPAESITVRISTTGNHHPRYFSYYPTEENWTEQFVDGMRAPTDSAISYSFEHTPAILPLAGRSFTPLNAQERTAYLQLPEATRAAAGKILDRLWMGQLMTPKNKVTRILDYVRNSAAYDLNTPAMPAGTEDFAIWFLEQSDTGYCTHFATAATILLRAANVPARYVIGYTINVKANTVYTVTGENAHAWVEYLDPLQGWTVLDPTPIDFGPVYTDATEPPETTAPTLPPETTAPTEPTAPTEETTPATEPTASAAPTDTRAPGPTPPKPLDWSWLNDVGMALAAAALVIFQYGLRKKLRRSRLEKLPPNKQALRCWKYVRRGCRMVQHAPPEKLKTLAEKAAFSQHTLTPEELELFHEQLRDLKAQLLQSWPKIFRWLLRLILAL